MKTLLPLALAAALLTGCAAIPAPYRERGQMAYRTGRRIVEMVHEDLKPSDILTHEAFLNAIATVSVIGGSSNAQPHIQAMAAHAGVPLPPSIWQKHGYDLPLLVNMQPAGAYLGERFHRAGGDSRHALAVHAEFGDGPGVIRTKYLVGFGRGGNG